MSPRCGWAAMLVPLIACAGCGAGEPPAYPAGAPPEVAPISVTRRDLTPTVSMDAQVMASAEFVVLAPRAGRFSLSVGPNTSIKAGRSVAKVGARSVVVPVDGVVTRVLADDAQTVPQGLPLLTVRYSGFALGGTPTTWTAGILSQPGIRGRGQVADASGPSTCLTVAMAAGASGLLDQEGSENRSWLCLLSKDVSAVPGRPGVVVATGTVAKQVVAVPVASVAGRLGAGQVARITNAGKEVVDVGLGRTDGSYIEITRGLSEGDQISALAPNLDVKSPG